MSRTYNVALVAAGLIFLLSITYYATQPAPTGADEAIALAELADPAPTTQAPDPGQAAADPPASRLATFERTPINPDPQDQPAGPTLLSRQTLNQAQPEPQPQEDPQPRVPTLDLTTPKPTPLEDPDPAPPLATPTAAADPTPAPPAPTTYAVQRGDTLSSIAVRLFGDESKWVDIAQANPTIDPIRLRIGQELKLPAASAQPASDDRAADAVEAPRAELRHTIQSGENLSSIAQRYYGKAARWRALFNANRDVLGNNPNAIRAGMVIVIPPLPIETD